MKTTARLVDPAAVGGRNVSLQPVWHRSVGLMLTLLCWISAAQFAAATTRTVTTPYNDGAGSLRQTIIDSADGDTIDAKGLSGAIIELLDELLVNKSITILGPGPDHLYVGYATGSSISRVFHIGPGKTVTIAGLTIQGGYTPGFGGGILNGGSALTLINSTLRGNVARDGGGIYNSVGTLTVSNCTIIDNYLSGGGSGGGIYNSVGTLTVSNCTIRGNVARDGGGIYNGHGNLRVSKSTFSGNYADLDGGGIYNDGSTGDGATLAITASSLSGNYTTRFGGGICNDGSIGGSATLTIAASTLSDNFAQYDGGGIYNVASFSDSSATLTITASTLSSNSIDGSFSPNGASIGNRGDATVMISASTLSVRPDLGSFSIWNAGSGITIGDSILDAGAYGENFSGGTFTSVGHNLASDAPYFFNQPGDQINKDPKLGPLQDNGGPTFTMRPLPGSAAIDAGDDSVTGMPTDLLSDQRGRSRWIGAHVDIGAVEVGPVTIVVANANDSGAGSLRQAISDASPVEGDRINFNPSITGTITLTSGELVIGRNLNINGPGANVLAISGNNASRVFHFTGGSSLISGLRIANGNTSGGGGGILMDAGTLNLNYCTVAACYAGYTSGGGGIFLGNSASLSLVGSTISGNSTPEYGGGLYLFNGAYAFVLNSTISGNSTLDGTDAGWGGGIFVQSSGSTLSMFNSTVASNSSVNAGGGIYRYQGTVTLADTLVAGNSAPSGPDCKGTFVSNGYNLIGNSSGSTGFGATGDQPNVNPLIGPLADNGGPTFTHALLTGSPAIDKGKSNGSTTDQRGRQRPYDFSSVANASGGDGSDIGAYEVNPPLLSISKSGSNVLLSWYTSDTGYTLEAKTNLSPAILWTTVPGTPATVGSQYVVTNGPATGNKFYRLKQ